MQSLVTSDVSVKVDSRSVVPYTIDVLLVLSLTDSYNRALCGWFIYLLLTDCVTGDIIMQLIL